MRFSQRLFESLLDRPDDVGLEVREHEQLARDTVRETRFEILDELVSRPRAQRIKLWSRRRSLADRESLAKLDGHVLPGVAGFALGEREPLSDVPLVKSARRIDRVVEHSRDPVVLVEIGRGRHGLRLPIRVDREVAPLLPADLAARDELTEDALVQILTEPKNALIKQYQHLLNMDGVELEIRPAALTAIARKALARKTGARGLRSILEQSLLDTMFELPNMEGVEKVVLDESTIEENAKPLLVYREQAKASA